MRGLTSDLMLAARRMWQARISTAVVVLTLALGIGPTTACFAALHASVFVSLPFPHASKIFSLQMAVVDPMALALARGDPLEWWERMPGTTAAAAYATGRVTLGDGGVQATAAEVSTGFFAVMGVRPFLGRTFSLKEEANQDPLAELSYAEWKVHYAARADVIGAAAVLDGQRFTVIGVMPRGFDFPARAAFWVPLRPGATDILGGAVNLPVIVRVDAGISQGELQNRVDFAASRIARQAPWLDRMGSVPGLPAGLNHRYHVVAVPLQRELLGKLQLALWALFLGACLVFLIACANAAFLTSAHYLSTLPTLAICAALGAGRVRLAWQTLLNSLLPALLGGAGGIWIAAVTGHALRAWLPSSSPGAGLAGQTTPAVIFPALALGAFAAVAVCAVPLIWSWKLKPRMLTGSGYRSAARSTFGLAPGGVLIAAQVGLATALAVGAALLLHSFAKLVNEPTGVNAVDVVVTAIPPDPSGHFLAQSERISATLATLEARPGIRAAALSDIEPFRPPTVLIGTVRDPNGRSAAAYSQRVSGSYFACLGIALKRGRSFDRTDSLASIPVAILSEGLAREMWPGLDPVGRSVGWMGGGTPASRLKVIGVAQETRLLFPGQPQLSTIYLDFRQAPDASVARGAYLLVKGRLPLRQLAQEIGASAGQVGLALPTAGAAAVGTLRQRALAPARARTGLLLLLASLGLGLACVGVYGILSFHGLRRRRDVGVRMALGASPLRILVSLALEAARIMGIGILLGALIAYWFTAYLRSLLFGLQPRDPLSFALAAATVAVSGMIAALVPAIKSAATDPCSILRED